MCRFLVYDGPADAWSLGIAIKHARDMAADQVDHKHEYHLEWTGSRESIAPWGDVQVPKGKFKHQDGFGLTTKVNGNDPVACHSHLPVFDDDGTLDGILQSPFEEALEQNARLRVILLMRRASPGYAHLIGNGDPKQLLRYAHPFTIPGPQGPIFVSQNGSLGPENSATLLSETRRIGSPVYHPDREVYFDGAKHMETHVDSAIDTSHFAALFAGMVEELSPLDAVQQVYGQCHGPFMANTAITWGDTTHLAVHNQGRNGRVQQTSYSTMYAMQLGAVRNGQGAFMIASEPLRGYPMTEIRAGHVVSMKMTGEKTHISMRRFTPVA